MSHPRLIPNFAVGIRQTDPHQVTWYCSIQWWYFEGKCYPNMRISFLHLPLKFGLKSNNFRALACKVLFYISDFVEKIFQFGSVCSSQGGSHKSVLFCSMNSWNFSQYLTFYHVLEMPIKYSSAALNNIDTSKVLSLLQLIFKKKYKKKCLCANPVI